MKCACIKSGDCLSKKDLMLNTLRNIQCVKHSLLFESDKERLDAIDRAVNNTLHAIDVCESCQR